MFDILHLFNVYPLHSDWVEIIHLRDSYLFVTSWGLTTALLLMASLVFFIVSHQNLKVFWGPRRTREIYTLLAIPLAFLILSLFTVDLLHLSTFVSLQLNRSLVIWKILLTILFAHYAWRQVLSQPRDWLYNYFLVSIIASVLVEELVMLMILPFFTLLWLEKRWFVSSPHDLPRSIHAFLFLGAYAASATAVYYTRPFLLLPLITITFISLALLYLASRPSPSTFSTVAIALLVFIVYGSNTVNSSTSLYPKYATDPAFMESCQWIKDHTDLGDIFVVEPFSTLGEELKFLCQRSLFYSWKDGAQVLFDESFALEWYRRHQLLTSDAPENQLLTGLLSEPADFIFSDHQLDPLSPHHAWSNHQYFIYHLNDQPIASPKLE